MDIKARALVFFFIVMFLIDCNVGCKVSTRDVNLSFKSNLDFIKLCCFTLKLNRRTFEHELLLFEVYVT